MAEVKIEEFDREKYPSNSHKKRQTKDQVVTKPVPRRIVTKKPEQPKKTVGQKFFEVFFSADGRDVGEYLFYDVLIPSLQQMIILAVTGGVNQLLGGNPRPAGVSRSGGKSYIPYGQGSRPTRADMTGGRNRGGYDLSRVVISERSEAEEVLIALDDMVADYGEATVRDFLEFVGEPSTFADDKYGWRDVSRGFIEPARFGNGFVIRLPAPRPLD